MDIEKLAVQKLTLGVDDFFDFNKQGVKPALYKPFKNHNYADLILLAGLYDKFEAASSDPQFLRIWSDVKNWNEGSRYISGYKPDKSRNFVNQSEEFCSWIKKHL